MRRLKFPVLALMVMLASACAPGTNAAMQGGGASSNAAVMTAEDLAPFAGGTLFDAINTANRQWLRTRGEDPVKVWLDGREMGGTGELRTILVDQVREVRYLLPRDAMQEYGMGQTSGAIQVITR